MFTELLLRDPVGARHGVFSAEAGEGSPLPADAVLLLEEVFHEEDVFSHALHLVVQMFVALDQLDLHLVEFSHFFRKRLQDLVELFELLELRGFIDELLESVGVQRIVDEGEVEVFGDHRLSLVVFFDVLFEVLRCLVLYGFELFGKVLDLVASRLHHCVELDAG